VPVNILSPRTSILVAPINDSEIAILGGAPQNFMQGDIFIFNWRMEKCEQVVSGKKCLAVGEPDN